MSNLNKIKEEGKVEFEKLEICNLDKAIPLENIPQVLDWHNKQIDKAYSLAIDDVVEKVSVMRNSYKELTSLQEGYNFALTDVIKLLTLKE